MDDRSGRWGNARAAMQTPRASDGRAALFLEALPSAEAFVSPRAWSFTLLGLDAYIRAAPANAYVSNLRHQLAEKLISSLKSVGDAGLGVVREKPRVRKRKNAAGADRHRHGHQRPRLRGCRSAIVALAHDAANHAGWLLPARRFAEFRRRVARAAAIRSTTAGSHRDHFSVSRSLARRFRSQVESRRLAGIRLVSRPQ